MTDNTVPRADTRASGDCPRDPVLRVVPRPADINANGHIFGGWVLSQMDIAGGIVAGREARIHKMPPGPNRWKERSRTFEGIAAAMADQWGNARQQDLFAEALK